MAQKIETGSNGMIKDVKGRAALSGWSMVIFYIAMIIFACYASTHMVGAGDTWVALACGRHFVNHGVNTVEPFSANSHHAGPTDASMTKYAQQIRADIKAMPEEESMRGVKTAVLTRWADWVGSYPQWPKWKKDMLAKWHPTGWINQNWLTHVIFYELVNAFGTKDAPAYDALIVWKFALYIVAVFVVFYTGKYLGVNPALAAVFACFAMLVGRTFLDVRPAGFSNLLTGVLIMVYVLTTYRNKLYIWLFVPIVALWSNLHGGYLYAFITIVPFVGMSVLAALPKKYYRPAYFVLVAGAVIYLLAKMYKLASATEGGASSSPEDMLLGVLPAMLVVVFAYIVLWNQDNLIGIGKSGVWHSIGAAVAGFIAMVIFNPFHLTNLTHTYVISISKHAEQWRTVNEWHSAWEWKNPVGDEIPFLVMFLLGCAVLLVWLIVWMAARPRVSVAGRNVKIKAVQPTVAAIGQEFAWPKVDMALLIIAVLTIYMAVRSRRFIPIAGMAACPVIALYLDQIIRMISAVWTNPGRMRLTVPSMPAGIQRALLGLAVLATVGLGSWWGYNYYKIYVAPWPDDDQYTSVFQRMTASYAKPFCAGYFMRENKLSGNMFNYWTEGGFIAWIQNPDPNTGRTPLQLFMDGRAQAAYEPASYEEWMLIMAGGPYAMGEEPDYKRIGDWTDKKLKSHKVWLVLMPAGQLDTPLVMGLERHTDWRTVFINNKQQIQVDISTKAGKDIFMAVLSGTAKFPDEFSKDLSRGHIMLQMNNEQMQAAGFDLAQKAFAAKPSQMPLIELLQAGQRDAQFGEAARKIINNYLDELDKNIEQWQKKDGVNDKIVAGIVIANYLQRTSSDPAFKDLLAKRSSLYYQMQRELVEGSRW